MRWLLLLPLLLLLAHAAGCAALHDLEEEDFVRLRARSAARAGELVATFFPCELGDALLLELPGGRTLLVDAGVGWEVEQLLAYLRARGIARLDAMLLTHPHLDHYGGMDEVLAQVEVGEFLHNGVRSDAGAYAALEEALAARGVASRVVRRGDRLDLDPDVTIDVLYPDPGAFERRSDHNAGSLVLRVTHGATRLLLMGDAEHEAEAWLVATEGPSGLRADALKLGHHASRLSGTRAFLEAVRPRVAIAQGTGFVDVPVFYPRPTEAIQGALRGLGATLLTCDVQGAVQVVSDGQRVRWSTPFGERLALNARLRWRS